MLLKRFLESLSENGEVEVGPGPLPLAGPQTQGWLANMVRRAAEDLPGEPPEWIPEVGAWAAQILFAACQGVVCRDMGEEEIASLLRMPCPSARSSAVDWSADLCLQQLPELFRQARHFSGGDPLVREIERLARDWPLSSVGIPGLKELGDLRPVLDHPALRQLYVDRILERRDVSRLGDAEVDGALRGALGAHPEMCPEVAYRLMPRVA